ncbi:BTB/POZ domain-containing protein At5g03250 [Linum grandiflorum]
MSFLRLGSKSEFHRQGLNWFCNNGLHSDIAIEVGEMCFNLHKFPLITRSGLLSDLIEQLPSEDGSVCSLKLQDLPGGAKAFELAAKFCYGVKFDLTASNVVSLRCAAEYLRMTEDFGEKNLILQTENFLKEVFTDWSCSVTALKSCQEILLPAEDLRIVSRCIHSLATKACSDPNSNHSSPPPPEENVFAWNGISKSISGGEDWWFEDVSFLNLHLYKRLILAVEAKGMKPETISASVMHYAKRYLPLMTKQQKRPGATPAGNPLLSEADQRLYLEEIVTLLPTQKGVTPTHFLLSLLRTAIFLHASAYCKENLEQKIGAQLDQASLQDLLIPNMGYSVETLYDVDCVQRIVDYFLSNWTSPPYSAIEEAESHESLTSMTVVASLVDGFLSEAAPDVNLKLSKFETLAATIPDYARPVDDGLYHAIDVYLKAHQWLTESEKEQLCRLMNCQKLSLEASTHAAQNERLPLRLIIQVLFFEQIRLRTTVSGWFFLTETLDNSNQISNNTEEIDQLQLLKNESSCQVEPEIRGAENDDDEDNAMKERVQELEKECLEMKEDIEKLVVKTKKSWRIFSKSSRLKQKLQSCNSQKSCDFKEPEPLPAPTSATNEQQQNPDIIEAAAPQNFRFH